MRLSASRKTLRSALEKTESKNGNYVYVWEYQTPYLVSSNCFAKEGYFFHLVHIDFLSLKHNTKLIKSI